MLQCTCGPCEIHEGVSNSPSHSPAKRVRTSSTDRSQYAFPLEPQVREFARIRETRFPRVAERPRFKLPELTPALAPEVTSIIALEDHATARVPLFRNPNPTTSFSDPSPASASSTSTVEEKEEDIRRVLLSSPDLLPDEVRVPRAPVSSPDPLFWHGPNIMDYRVVLIMRQVTWYSGNEEGVDHIHIVTLPMGAESHEGSPSDTDVDEESSVSDLDLDDFDGESGGPDHDSAWF